jgi:hypothetical protein
VALAGADMAQLQRLFWAEAGVTPLVPAPHPGDQGGELACADSCIVCGLVLYPHSVAPCVLTMCTAIPVSSAVQLIVCTHPAGAVQSPPLCRYACFLSCAFASAPHPPHPLPSGARRLLRWRQRLVLHVAAATTSHPAEARGGLAVAAADLATEAGLGAGGLAHLLRVAGSR